MSAALKVPEASPLDGIPLTLINTLVLLSWTYPTNNTDRLKVRVFTSQCRLGSIARRFVDHGEHDAGDVVCWAQSTLQVELNGLDRADVLSLWISKHAAEDMGWYATRVGYCPDDHDLEYLEEELLYFAGYRAPRPVETVELPPFEVVGSLVVEVTE